MKTADLTVGTRAVQKTGHRRYFVVCAHCGQDVAGPFTTYAQALDHAIENKKRDCPACTTETV